MNWSRAAEITCDRAGLICCGDLDTAQRSLATLMTGGVAALRGINIDEYVRQLNQVRSSPLRLLELFQTHPLIPKRLEALRLFAECDVFFDWRTDLERPTDLRSREDVDAACARLLGVLVSNDDPQPARSAC
jgi:hypothetical protein